ncbi:MULTISPECIES: hypothetical protein [unclassified Streptomyces]|uniref:hypothetical protein n=1 Tax=unclassified Streptomyces TaxID=2593676 RepID=UPI0029620B41|nr:hypothetical protein [Streptomyces sp. N50]WOX13851.1 hypothetical protein R2B38_35690 [Streptomyces sp. N50]
MRKMLSTAAAFATATIAVVAMSGAAQAKPAGGVPWDGCPSGAVCIYGEGVVPKDNPHPTDVYYSYGAHNLSNQFGQHWILNNQTGGASVTLCNGSNGTNCTDTIAQDNGLLRNFTPINSIVLNRP